MLQPAFPVLEILAQLPPGGLLLTPNNRLRNRCQQLYAAKISGAKSWAPPAVESLQGWLDKTWFRLQQNGYRPALKQVLNAEQRQLLWQRALDETLERQLLNSPQLCRDADSALSQLFQWQLLDNLENLGTAIKAPLEQFALSRADFPLFDLIEAFARQLNAHDAITPDQRDLLIAQALAGGELAPLPQITMAGFVQASPLALHIIDCAATKVVRHTQKPRQAAVTVAPSRTLEDELYQAARWSAGKLAKDPHASIGIVVNNLGQCRAQVETVFARVLEPQMLAPQQRRYTLPFNFSAGTPLAQTPVGAGALQLLDLLLDQWDYSQLRNILFSPFWGGGDGQEDETWLRTALFRQLQKQELWRVSGDTLRHCAERTASKLAIEAPRLTRQLEQLGDWRRRWKKAPAEIWAQRFSQVLGSLGWPGPRNPDSQEYQQLNLWEKGLEELAALSAFGGTLTLTQALQQLRRIANRTPFQAETRDGPAQILGVLEAGGLAFDHLRLVGFGQQQWPPAPTPNPLLPVQWQKHWQMPRASAERELELARQLTADLLSASAQVVVSYACEADGVGQALSTLFPPSESEPPLDSDALQDFYGNLGHGVQLLPIPDDQLPPLSADECAQARGGASVLKAQALCPQNAQLRYRLGAISYTTPVLGLNPAERGNLVHQALANFWQRCGDSACLQLMDELSRQQSVSEAVTGAVRQMRRRHSHLPEGFWQLEQRRLERLLEQWLPLETNRPAFSVTKVEWAQAVEIGGLHFNLRLDRLDQLGDGEQLVIDYKTGQPSISDWLQERVREPQLPLYALFQPHARAIAFAQVRYGDCKWRGCGELNQPFEGIKAVADTQKNGPFGDWKQLSDHWRQSLEQIAQEYRNGHAVLVFDRPTDNDSTLWPLNRWPEREQANQ